MIENPLPPGWRNARLGFLVDTYVPQRDKPDPLDGPIPWVRIEDFHGQEIRTSKSGRGVTSAQVADMNLRVFSPGTVLCSCSCSMGATAIVREPLVSNQTFIGLTPGPDVESRFLFYLMHAMRERLQSLATGAIQQYLSRDDFRSLRVPLPGLAEQCRIADFLDSETAGIDRLSAARRRHVALVQERWESSIHHELAQDAVEPVELRRLGVAVTTGPFGTVFNASEYEADGIPMVNPLHIKNGEIVPDRHHSVSRATAARLARYQLRAGDLVVGRKGDLGRAALVNQRQDGWVCGSDCIALHPSSQLRPRFLAYALRSQFVRAQLLARSLAATMPSLNEGNLLSLRIPKFGIRHQDRVIDRLDGVHHWTERVIATMNSQLSLLAERRQALITAAVTGQFDVSTASGRNVTDGVTVA